MWIFEKIPELSLPIVTWSKYGTNGGFRVKMWNFGPRNFKPFGVQNESRVIYFGSPGHQEQTSFQNKYFNLEFTITWMVVDVKNGILEGDNWFLKTFQTLRTCVTNISYVTNMCNQFSFLLKLWKQIWFRMKITKSPWKQQTMKISKKHAWSANITPWLNRILLTIRPSSITFDE